jgi:hypothetical protein
VPLPAFVRRSDPDAVNDDVAEDHTNNWVRLKPVYGLQYLLWRIRVDDGNGPFFLSLKYIHLSFQAFSQQKIV